MSGAMTFPWWSYSWPALGLGVLTAAATTGTSSALLPLAGFALIATVFAAVYHAEVVAHRVGEPFGTLVLAIAVTVIEVALILSVMIAAPAEKAGIARDTVYAAVMIVCNGIVGVSLLSGGVRHHEQGFQQQSASAALAVLAALVTLTLIVPNVTTSAPGPQYNTSQLAFAAVISLVLYGSFVFVQTISHRDYFLPPGPSTDDDHAAPPTERMAMLSFALLLASLVAVVGLAKVLTPAVETFLDIAGAPKATVGIAIAGLVLLPEGLAALRAARANRLQTSLNLALGSALASIGLTIPAVAVASILFGYKIDLGLGPKDVVLVGLTLILGIITLGNGRTTVLQGIVHLAVFAAFIFFSLVP